MKRPRTAALQSLVLATTAVVTVTGCAAGSGASAGSPVTGTAGAAAEQSPAGAAKPSTMTDSSVISVTSGDTTCMATADTVPAGRYTVIVHNTADQVAEVYLYGAGDTVIAEIEDVGPATEKDLDVDLTAGDYELACKPGMTGPGIRVPLTVTG